MVVLGSGLLAHLQFLVVSAATFQPQMKCLWLWCFHTVFVFYLNTIGSATDNFNMFIVDDEGMFA